MSGYLVNFAVYTMAMIGLIFFALMVYKKFTLSDGIKSSKSKMLSVEETISIAPRKTLYVVRAGAERFLIAGDVDKTTLISKLAPGVVLPKKSKEEIIKEGRVNSLNQLYPDDAPVNIRRRQPQAVVEAEAKAEVKYKNSVDDLPVIVDFENKTRKPSVINNMMRKING